MPSTDQLFRISWASFSMGEMSSESDIASDNSIFVGDLASDVNDAALLETFSSRYSSVKDTKVVIDANTGRSKGYGFVLYHASGLVSLLDLFGREIHSEVHTSQYLCTKLFLLCIHSLLLLCTTFLENGFVLVKNDIASYF